MAQFCAGLNFFLFNIIYLDKSFKRDIIVKTATQPNLKHEPNILGIMKSRIIDHVHKPKRPGYFDWRPIWFIQT